MILCESKEEKIETYINTTTHQQQELYTYPWTLFRVIPSMEGASVTDDYEGRVYAQKTYVANYERNFCSFTTSNLPIKMTEYCDYDNVC